MHRSIQAATKQTSTANAEIVLLLVPAGSGNTSEVLALAGLDQSREASSGSGLPSFADAVGGGG